jgi:hypothetical protein
MRTKQVLPFRFAQGQDEKSKQGKYWNLNPWECLLNAAMKKAAAVRPPL